MKMNLLYGARFIRIFLDGTFTAVFAWRTWITVIVVLRTRIETLFPWPYRR